MSAKAEDGFGPDNSRFRLKVERLLTFRKSDVYSFCLAMLYALIISGYPLVANISIYLDTPNRSFGITVRAIILLLSIILIMWIGVMRRRMYTGIWGAPLAVFWVLYIGRMVTDTVILQVPLAHPYYEYYMYAIGGCLVPMLAFMVRPDTNALRRAFRLTYSISVLATILLLINFLVVRSDASYWIQMGRLGADSLNPISIGHLATTVILLSVASLLSSDHRIVPVKIITALLIIMLGLLTLTLAASKGPVLALAAAGLSILVVGGNRIRWTVGAISGAAIVIGAVTVVSVYLASWLGSSMTHRYDLLLQGHDEGVNTRLTLLSEAMKQFYENPIMGSGLELTEYASYPHNVVVESFMATGIVGGLLFTMLVVATAFRALHIIRYSPQSSWIGLLYIQYLAGALVSGALAYSTVMWALMGAVIGLSYSHVQGKGTLVMRT